MAKGVSRGNKAGDGLKAPESCGGFWRAPRAASGYRRRPYHRVPCRRQQELLRRNQLQASFLRLRRALPFQLAQSYRRPRSLRLFHSMFRYCRQARPRFRQAPRTAPDRRSSPLQAPRKGSLISLREPPGLVHIKPRYPSKLRPANPQGCPKRCPKSAPEPASQSPSSIDERGRLK